MKKMAALLTSLLLVVSLAGPAVAAPRQTTITLSPAVVTHGDVVTYTVTTSADVSNLWVLCYRDNQIIYSAGGLIHRESVWSETHIMASGAYSSGEASCAAQVNAYHNDKRVPKALLIYNFISGA